jgi:hypothetical protein
MKSIKKITIGAFTILSLFGFSFAAKAASPNNSTPILFEPNPSSTIVVAGNLMNFTLSGFDFDITDILTYGAQNLPTGATLNTTTGLFNWLPGLSQVGNYTIDFSVSDGIDSNVLPVILTVVAPVVTPPTSTPTTTPHKPRHGKKHREDRREEKRKSEIKKEKKEVKKEISQR